MILKISGIPGSMTDDQLFQFLAPFATIHSAKVVLDKVTQKSRRFGFVQVNTASDTKRLIEVFHNKQLSSGQVLKVVEYKP